MCMGQRQIYNILVAVWLCTPHGYNSLKNCKDNKPDIEEPNSGTALTQALAVWVA